MVGECRVKKFGCKLGALQRAFREHAFLRQGGDALKDECDRIKASFDNQLDCFKVETTEGAEKFLQMEYDF